MDKYREDFEYVLEIAAMVLGILNYTENLTQNDKQEIIENLTKASDAILQKIDAHLQIQDKKLNKILELLKNNNNNYKGGE